MRRARRLAYSLLIMLASWVALASFTTNPSRAHLDCCAAGYPATIDQVFNEVKKLTASDCIAEDQFGRWIAISNDTVVVGANADDNARGSFLSGTREGHLYATTASGSSAALPVV